MNCRQN